MNLGLIVKCNAGKGKIVLVPNQIFFSFFLGLYGIAVVLLPFFFPFLKFYLFISLFLKTITEWRAKIRMVSGIKADCLTKDLGL